MAGTEERPSKIRKVDRSDNVATRYASPTPQATETTEERQDALSTPPSTTPAPTAAEAQEQDQPQLSKSQLKKLRKREQWEAGKESRKAFRREKHKQKQARKAEERAAQKENSAAESNAPSNEALKQKNNHRRPVQTPVGLILDCDFDHLMTEKEIISLGAQITRCYSDNRTSPYRSHMVVNSWGGQLKTRFETVLANTQLGWKGVIFTEKDFVEAARDLSEVMKGPEGGKLVGAFAQTGGILAGSKDTQSVSSLSTVAERSPEITSPTKNETAELEPGSKPELVANESTEESILPNPESTTKTERPPKEPKRLPTEEELNMEAPSIVYLTADSPNTIDHLSPYTSYIIGGIVDKNRHKGICYKRARERGIPTGKLPIGEYMTMQSRTVLTVNHVMEIMLKWLETGDWGEAFLSVIPKRKEAKLKVKRDGETGLKDGEEKNHGLREKTTEEDVDAKSCEDDDDGDDDGDDGEKYEDARE